MIVLICVLMGLALLTGTLFFGVGFLAYWLGFSIGSLIVLYLIIQFEDWRSKQ